MDPLMGIRVFMILKVINIWPLELLKIYINMVELCKINYYIWFYRILIYLFIINRLGTSRGGFDLDRIVNTLVS